MTPRLETIEEIFHAALECEPDQLSAFLDKTCGGDEVLRRRVEELLAAHRQATDFIETPIANVANVAFGADRETDLLIGQTIGHYRILERIGAGGMGAVYLAERADKQYKKRVAIKLIKRGMDTDSVLRHFRNERQILASFDHLNIARLLDGGATGDGLPYFVMEYVEGIPIDKYCDAHRLSIAERLKLFREVCGAVSYAHRRGVIHRDIKPSNIIISIEGVPKLLDFGIAKALQQSDGTEATVTMTLARPMTPEYASPEQVRGERVTPATDVYSLGVVFYQLLTGQQPYRLKTRTPDEISRAVAEQEPTLPSTAIARSDGSSKSQVPNPKLLRGDLDNIVLKALRKEPERRYQSVEQLSDDIRRHLEARPVLARKDTAAYRTTKFVRRNPALAGAAAACLLLALAVVWLLREQFSAPKTPAPEKSIAVLPFENHSRDPDNAYFADGVQDEILTDLAKIADLKVISRTSVRQYKSGTVRNLREIGKQLGVAHLLEGSVQRVGNRIRINAQLIDARTDAHRWAQTYDRDLADVFAIQSEIARAIAEQLQAKLSPSEKSAIAQRPTTDLTANALYTKAKELEFTGPEQQSLLQAVHLLQQAVERDPEFVLAYCVLGRLHLKLYWGGYDHTPARRDLANSAIQKAVQLQPDAGEVHLAQAIDAYQGFRDYDRARAELDLARRTVPNNAEVSFVTGLIDRRQGRWTEATRNFERAVELDPRNFSILMETGDNYLSLRRYSEASRLFERAVTIAPGDYWARIFRGLLPFFERAEIGPLRTELSAILKEQPGAAAEIADMMFRCAMAEHDAAAANRALAAVPPEGTSPGGNFIYPREWFIGVSARTFNDTDRAREAFTAAREIEEKLVSAQPDYAAAWSLLGRIDAALGRKKEAIYEGRHACELMPVAKDAGAGAEYIANLAVIYAWTGEKDLAFEQLTEASRLAHGVSFGELKLEPQWDPLRGDPRFEKIAASLAPK